jgi:hypothetical protein
VWYGDAVDIGNLIWEVGKRLEGFFSNL